MLPVTWNEFVVTHCQGSVSWKEHRLLTSNRSLLIPFQHLLTTCQNEDKTESLSNPTTDSITLQFSLQGYGGRGSCSLYSDSCQKGMAEHLKVLKEGKLQPRIVYPAQLSFRIEKEINNFADKQKLKTFIAIKSAL